jgi:hypothetical protein
MSGETDSSGNPNPKNDPGLKFLWLFCAFIPSLAGIMLLSHPFPWAMQFAFFLNVVCSLAAGIGLLSGMEEKVSQIMLGIFLGGGFFFLNVVIVIFVGCSGMGRIAP